jgi:sigma-B regulation protein RsbU (phosphoserine phosphatase)
MPARLKTLLEVSGWWGIAFVALAVLDLALRLAGIAILQLRLAVYIAAMGLAIRLYRRLSRKLIWKLRNRLIFAYIYIAVAPVVLILFLVVLGGWAVVGQMAVHLVNSELDRRTEALNILAKQVAKAAPEERTQAIRQAVPFMQHLFPNAEMVVRSKDLTHFPENSVLPAPPGNWKDVSGLVIREGQVYSWAHVVNSNADVTIAAELTPDFLADLVPGIGDVLLFSAEQPSSGAKRGRRRSHLPPASYTFDVDFPWITVKFIPYWDSPDHIEKAGLTLHTRASAVLGIVFGRGMDSEQTVLYFFVFVAGVLVVMWISSFFVGLSLTRTITGAVHNLYEGTQHIKVGDFSHRIPVSGADQLAELGRSFNGMTDNLARLILVEKEQERLHAELEIAREVQGQLFPRGAPALKTLELAGVCNPARTVSGDYYDFIPLPEGAVALALGDVAGKGISAALLMASIQSIMRTQLTAGIPASVYMSAAGSGEAPLYSTGHMVEQLNRQVFANTAPEKYATFFFGIYDENGRTLTYTNAGHLPPIVLRGGGPEMLEVTGTVVGAFPTATFEDRTVHIGPGDLFIAYTDGIVEPENEYGEAFGEDRLLELLARYKDRDIEEIIAHIMEAVVSWTGSSELQDDMTVLLARGLA